jgi:hypothetical protein
MMRFGIRGHSRSEGTAKGTTDDRAVSTTDLVAYGCTRRAANPASYSRIHGRIPGVCYRREQSC